MKNYFSFVLLFFIASAYCQSGKVEYSIKSIDFTPKAGSKYSDLTSDLKTRGEKRKFILLFNSKKSKFSIIKNLDIDDASKEAKLDKMASIRFGSIDTYFFDKIKNQTLKQNEDGVLLKENEQEWEITSENKNIESYNCYKAILKLNYLARDGGQKTKTITAWFAPILPYGYGPKGYNGLPGLILELQDQETTFLATKIELQKKEIIISVPKGKAIDKNKYDRSMYQNK